MIYTKFVVRTESIHDFLGILDPGQSALVTYVSKPCCIDGVSIDGYYSVELSHGTSDIDIVNGPGVVAMG